MLTFVTGDQFDAVCKIEGCVVAFDTGGIVCTLEVCVVGFVTDDQLGFVCTLD